MCIISQKYNCIFVHIPKNAGGSVRQAMTQQGGEKPQGLYQHTPATKLQECLGLQYNDYFSFAIVRNPWDRMWSIYKFALERNKEERKDVGTSFDEFLMNKYSIHGWTSMFNDPQLPIQRRSQTEWILDEKNNLVVDFVGRFEHLKRDIGHIEHRTGLHGLLQAQHHRTNPSVHYTEAYSKEGIKFIREHFAKDIEMFNYAFGE